MFFSTPQRLRFNEPPVQWVRWTIYPGLKRPGSEADHTPPSSEKLKNGGAIPPLPIYFHGVVFNY
jgi:hypothetical protein